MDRRGRDRTIDSDPATQGAVGVPKALEPPGDPAGMHRQDDLERLLDREGRTDDDVVTVHAHDRRPHERPADPQSPEELAAEAIALATQGGGSFLEDDAEPGLEDEVDRDAIAAGIVPQLVGQATLESASAATSIEEQSEADEEAPTLPRTDRPRPGRTAAAGARAQAARRGDAR